MNHSSLTIRIGLLATGNELIEGDILNTNGQFIARQLTDAGLTVGLHVIAPDTEADIIDSLNYLFNHHTIIIMIGGLGPTSDDRTRFALSTAINKPLVFDETTWNAILQRYQKLNIAIAPHPNNQQQALFPAGATILPNHNGTAAGCAIQHNDKIIYMLPGPPNECLPMFKEYLLPELISKKTHNKIKKLKWRLLGVIESEIAAKVEEIVKHYPITTGYRIDYPYLEIKLYTQQEILMQEIENKINELFANYLIADINKTASELLKEIIIDYPYPIVINDQATHGQLQAQLINPFTYQKLFFNQPNTLTNAVKITITGLNEFWQKLEPTGQSSLMIDLTFQQQRETINATIPFRNAFVIKYAVEYISYEVVKFLMKLNPIFP